MKPGPTELALLHSIDASFLDAERRVGLHDLPDDDSVEAAEARDNAYDEIFHCETCIVREILTVVWPPVEDYITWLRAQIPGIDVE